MTYVTRTRLRISVVRVAWSPSTRITFIRPRAVRRESVTRAMQDLRKRHPRIDTPPALLAYQLSLRAPKAPEGSFDRTAAARGKHLFRTQAGCATCHRGPHLTDVLSGPDQRVPFLHQPAEVGMDPAYAERSATGKYRTTPLRALWQHPPYFHDGSAPNLLTVVEHYDRLFGLNLTAAQKRDLVECLKAL